MSSIPAGPTMNAIGREPCARSSPPFSCEPSTAIETCSRASAAARRPTFVPTMRIA